MNHHTTDEGVATAENVDFMVNYAKDDEDDTAADEEEKKGKLPGFLVLLLQIPSGITKGLIIFLIGLPWQAIIWTITLVDWLYNLVIRILFGVWCKPCAVVLVWALKLPTLPFVFLGWFFRIIYETAVLPLDGILLLFGSGCYLRWGAQCRFSSRFKDKKYWQKADVPIFMSDPHAFFGTDPNASLYENLSAVMHVPTIDNYADFGLTIAKEGRQELQ